ncbi:MAG TPA: hypothetical protein VKG63_07825 [Steroidobacteraceae bacterium]|nr:hypothetical protein [Steroidobacteraceae bacterium]
MAAVLTAVHAIAAAPVLSAAPAMAEDAVADKPSALSVTVYRAPERGSGSIDLDDLGGFALISETRTVHLPAGSSRLRFEGVADGIEPASAIVTGLPGGVIEKNRDGKLLSPSALIAAALDKPVTLLRTDQKTGKLTRTAGRIRSDADGGVVFETSAGVEALRCSGLPETFSFEGLADLRATPTLSVLVRSAEPLTRTVTLSYLARDFDWAADYIATVSADGKTMDLGAWVTLANGNAVGFPSARAFVVAGRVNRESGEVEPLDAGGPILAQCWPQGSTSDPQYLQRIGLDERELEMSGRMFKKSVSGAGPAMFQVVALAAQRPVEQEQLGDLKLYRVPDRTTVASRQSKQVRLLDRTGIPVRLVYSADVAADEIAASAPASRLLRTKNDVLHHLGLPLPSGRIAVFASRGAEQLLLQESGMRDLAVDEDVEISLGGSPDVEVAAQKGETTISNARAGEILFELRLRLPAGATIVHADHPLDTKNGRPLFRLTIPANESVTVRYQWRPRTG